MPVTGHDSVFTYLARDGERNLLIDAGWDNDEAYSVLVECLREIGIELSSLNRIIVSTCNPDHFGLTRRLRREAADCRVVMHSADEQRM